MESDERIRNLKKTLLDEIKVSEFHDSNFSKDKVTNFIEKIENKGSSSINIRHTPHDLDYLLNDLSARHLGCYISYDDENKISGVVFTQKEELSRMRIVSYYIADNCSFYALLDFIKRQFPDYSMSVNTSDPKYQTHSLIQQTYVSENPAGGDLDNTFGIVEIPFNINKLLQPLGMVRLLRFDRILEYIASIRSDVDFKLHIRDYNPDLSYGDLEEKVKESEYKSKKTVYQVKNGKLQIIRLHNIEEDRSILNLSIKEVSELLLRKNDSSNLIMEAFGIPRLNLQVSLLPY